MAEQLPRIVRIHPVSGRLARPWRGRDHRFQLAAGPDQPALTVDDYPAAVALVRAGHAIRMYDGRARPAFIAPRLLRITQEPVANPEHLWAYVLPDPPCPRATVLAEAEAAAQSHPDWAAHCRRGPLALAGAAYDSAFRQGADLPLDSRDFEAVLAALAYWRALGRPAACLPALRQTLRCAALRAGLVRGELAAVAAVLDLPLAAALGELAGLGYTAARNSLSQAGLHASIDEDPVALLRWLDTRRNFAPLRESERRA